MIRLLRLFAPALVLLAACGGGGGGAAPPPPNVAENLYVRTAGTDTNDGLTPDKAFRQVATAASHSTPGDTIVVGPGTYGPVNIVNSGTAAQRITFLADPSGQLTGDAPGEVILDAANASGVDGAFKVSGSNHAHIMIDGFTVIRVTGGSTGGIHIKSGASDVTVRNCTVRDNAGHGIRIAGATDVTVANNLVHKNGADGIHVLGAVINGQIQSLGLRVYNNTIFGNTGDGITVGSNKDPAKDTVFINNIIKANSGTGFNVSTGPPSSLDGLVERFNLNADSYSGITMGTGSMTGDPLFIMPAADDFHLAQTPMQQTTSPAVNAGDPNTPADIAAVLRDRTTATSGAPDSDAVDLGYHYPR